MWHINGQLISVLEQQQNISIEEFAGQKSNIENIEFPDLIFNPK